MEERGLNMSWILGEGPPGKGLTLNFGKPGGGTKGGRRGLDLAICEFRRLLKFMVAAD